MAITGNAEALGRELIDVAAACFGAGLDGDSETEPFVLLSVRVPMSIAVAVQAAAVDDVIYPEPFCRMCGCTAESACRGGCYWVEPNLCSRCVGRVPVVLELAPRGVEVR